MTAKAEAIAAEQIEEGDEIRLVGDWGSDLDQFRRVEGIEEQPSARILTLGGAPFQSSLGGNQVRVRRNGQAVHRIARA